MQDPTFQAINSAAAAGGSATTAAHNHHQLYPEQEQLKCPRCESTNTKFCYYNNYNLSQPRHFCKNCRRYWTKGGALRNIPVGGGTRKNNNKRSNSKRANSDAKPEPTRNKEPSSSSPSATSATTTGTTTKIKQPAGNGIPGSGQNPTRVCSLAADSDGKMLDMGGSFSSLLTSSGQFGSIFDGLNHNESGLKMVQMGGFAEDLNAGLNPDSDRHLGLDVQVSGNGNNGGGNSSGGDGDGYLQSSGDWGTSNGWPDLAIYTPGSNFQ